MSAASRATGRSDVPAASTVTSPPVGAGGSGGHATSRAVASCRASGSTPRTAAAAASSTRVNSVGPCACSRTSAGDRRRAAPASCPRRAPPRGSRAGPSVRGRGGRSPRPGRHPRPVTSGSVNAPDWMPARSSGHEAEPGGQHRLPQCGAHRLAHGADEVVRRELDAGDLAVVPHADVGEAQPAQRRLGLLDLAELVRRHRLAVRDARGQARRGRLVGVGQAERAGDPAHRRLVHPGVGQRAQHAVLRRGPRARPVGTARVVGVLAVGDRPQAVRGDHLVADAGEQLVLAVEAAVGAVAAVGRVVALRGADLDDPHAQRAGDRVRARPLVGGQAGRHAEDRDDAVRPEPPGREGEQHRASRRHRRTRHPSGAVPSSRASTRATAAASSTDQDTVLVIVRSCHGDTRGRPQRNR